MAKKANSLNPRQGACLSRIEHGAIVDKTNVVTVFEPGDDVSGVGEDSLAALVASGVVDPAAAVQSQDPGKDPAGDKGLTPAGGSQASTAGGDSSDASGGPTGTGGGAAA